MAARKSQLQSDLERYQASIAAGGGGAGEGESEESLGRRRAGPGEQSAYKSGRDLEVGSGASQDLGGSSVARTESPSREKGTERESDDGSNKSHDAPITDLMAGFVADVATGKSRLAHILATLQRDISILTRRRDEAIIALGLQSSRKNTVSEGS